MIPAFLLVGAPAAAIADGPPRLTVNTSAYPYLDRVENDTDLSVTIGARLPVDFSYFGWMNFRGVLSSGDIDMSRSEQSLRWAFSEKLPVDLNFQAVIIDGGGNDFSQLGFSWRVSDTPGLRELFDRINLTWRMTFHLKRFASGDDSLWQMEHSFRLRFPAISDRLYVGGFVDQTFDQALPDSIPDSPVVAEVQGGVRVWKDFYLVAEYRINEYRQGDEYNLAAGIEYRYAWR